MIRKVGILGVSGRMGGELAALLAEGVMLDGDGYELADAIAGSGRLHSVEGVPVRRLEDPPREPVHGWIDFSRPEASLALLEQAEVPVVVATTGFTPEQRLRIAHFAEKIPVLLAPNTSPGIAVVLGLLRHVPSAAPGASGFEVLVEEAHHRNKKDAPSGTAKAILERLAAKGYDRPQVHVTRAGGLPGDHAIRFVAEDEELVISHRAWNRRVFARGALAALHFLLGGRPPGLYSMEDVYGERS